MIKHVGHRAKLIEFRQPQDTILYTDATASGLVTHSNYIKKEQNIRANTRLTAALWLRQTENVSYKLV